MKVKHLTILSLTIGLGIATTTARNRTFGDGLPEYLQQFDVNEDGMIDEEEKQAIREARRARHEEFVAQWDADGDGRLSREEVAAAREAIRGEIQEKREARFAEIAGDDGLLSAEEFAAIEALADVDPERVTAIFNRMDADDSGDVTLEEFTARLRHHRKPPRRPGGDRPERPERPERPDDGEGAGGEGEGPDRPERPRPPRR